MMKAIHRTTKRENLVSEILGDKVNLVDLTTGQERLLNYKLFKKNYKLVEGEANLPDKLVDLNSEKELAQLRAREVEAELGGKGDTIRIDFNPTKQEKIAKPNVGDKTPKASKPKPNKGKKETKPKNKESGTTNLKDLCNELGFDQAKARRILRKQNIEKPYEWVEPELSKIKELLK